MRKDEQHWLEQLVELVESLERESMWADRSRAKKRGTVCPYRGALKKVQDEGDGTAVDAYEEVDAW